MEDEKKDVQEPIVEQEATIEEEQKPTGRKALRARYAERHPERNWDDEDDDALADQAMSDYDDISGKMAERDETDKKLAEMFEKDPQSASFLLGMARGEDFLVNLQRNFGEDIVEAMNNPDKLEELKKANQEYQERVAKNKQLQDEWDDNMEQSLETLAQAQQELGLSDDDVQAGMDILGNVVNEYNNGKISLETIQMFLKAKNHDVDVEDAKRKGEVRGRNANIEEKLRKSRSSSDGMPNLGGQSNNGAKGVSFKRGQGTNSGSIWDRANMKRTTYE